MQVINTNVGSLNAQRVLASTQQAQQTAMERLSSGVRINRAKDDAAGLAISNSMSSQIIGVNQAVRNLNDGISLVQTAEGSLSDISDIFQRIRELKVQASNGTNNSTQIGYLDEEYAALADEIHGTLLTTAFNNMGVLGSTGFDSAFTNGTNITIQKGWESGDTITINTGLTTAVGSAIDTVTGGIKATVSTSGDFANNSTMSNVKISEIDEALRRVNEWRVSLGADQNRMEHSISNLKNFAENISASRSRILDADFAAESAELSRTSVLQQAGMAMLSQANQSSQQVLSLLR